MCDWSAETIASCRKLKRILESGDAVTAAAITANLYAFEKSVDREDENKMILKELEIVKHEVENFKKMQNSEPNAGIDLAAGSDTGS